MDHASLSQLVSELFLAIQALGGYEPPAVAPEIHQVPQAFIQQEFCSRPCSFRALYDPVRGVYIDEAFDLINDPLARSILLHELVHHAQAVSRRFESTADPCVRYNRAEAEAYLIQNRYLMSLNVAHRVAMSGWFMRCRAEEVPEPKKS
ncbi:MAG TPA: DUF6647 family protein [Burkholderiales bacterium]|jgi:hypothetical protein|nr:DUF6647 family protein [Burkholderiales bacterium]